jgi:hypothetical protein
VSSVRTVTSSTRKTSGESVSSAARTSDVGAKDWMKTGLSRHAGVMYLPPYPYFFSVATNLSSYLFPSAHFTCRRGDAERSSRGDYILSFQGSTVIED